MIFIFTPVKLDKMRNFRYGMKALHQIEKLLKIKIMNLNLDELSLYELSVILWAGLVHEDVELTPDKVMDLIDDHSNITDISQVMGEAFAIAFGGGVNQGKK